MKIAAAKVVIPGQVNANQVVQKDSYGLALIRAKMEILTRNINIVIVVLGGKNMRIAAEENVISGQTNANQSGCYLYPMLLSLDILVEEG